MLKLMIIALFILAPTSSFAIDLSQTSKSVIELEEMLEGGRSRVIGNGAWGPVLPGDPQSGQWGEIPASDKTKIRVTIKNDGIAMGTYTTEVIGVDEANKMMNNSETLNTYIKNGGKISLNANPTGEDLSRSVMNLENSNDVQVVRRFFKGEVEKLKEKTKDLEEKNRICRKEKKDEIRARREGRNLPKREIELKSSVSVTPIQQSTVPAASTSAK